MFIRDEHEPSGRVYILWIAWMTWTLDSSGTQTNVIGTEETLATSTSNGTFQFFVRLNNMAVGDVFELRMYTITLIGGTLELVWKATFGPALPVTTVVASPPMASDQSVRVSVKQIAGTARATDWKLLRI